MFCCGGRRLKKSVVCSASPSYSLLPQTTTAATMGHPSNEQRSPLLTRGSASFSSAHMSTQHERLILELLPFKDLAAFNAWLGSMYVHGAWVEFVRDCLAPGSLSAASASSSGQAAIVSEPDKAKTAQAAKDAVKGQQAKFLVYHPDKEGWTLEDHHVRFIATVVQDNLLKGTWSNSDFKNKGLDITKAVYEVLMYLRATYYPSDPNPPGYTA